MTKNRREKSKSSSKHTDEKRVRKRAKSEVSSPKKEKKTPSFKSKDESVQALIRANTLALAGVLGLVAVNLSLVWYTSTAKTEIIAVTETGKIINPIPLPEAFVTDSRVISFVDSCMRDSFSHDFENYRKTVNAAMSCYTTSGGVAFKESLEGTLEDITKRRLVMSVTLEPPSVVSGPYVSRGRATWNVQTVVTTFYQGATQRYTPQSRLASVTVVRVPLEENPAGIAINTIQLAPYSGR